MLVDPMDLESQNEVSVLVSEKDSWRISKWRFVFMAVQFVHGFATTTVKSPERDDEMDLESQNEVPVVVSEEDSWRISKWRLVSMAVQFVHSFAPTTVKSPELDDELPFLTEQGDGAHGDVEMTSISTVLQANTHSEFNQANKSHSNDRHQQYANMAIIIKNKDLNSLNQYGGVKGFAEALGIDLEQGLPNDLDHDILPVKLWPQSNTPPGHSEFIHILKNTCNKYILMQILLSAILLLILGLKEEGWETGWYRGVLILLAILVLITVSVTCKYWLLLRWSHIDLSSKREVYVSVLRGGQQCKLSLSKVRLGDVVCLNVGDEVPADGLFVGGDSLRLDGESQSTITDQYPFLFCGSNVIHGKGHMIVTSIGKDTVLGAIMSEVTNAPTFKTSLQLQLEKLNNWMQCIALLVTNFIIILTLLRYTFGKEQGCPGSPDVKRKPAALLEFINAFQEIITKDRKLGKFISSLTTVLLGFTEGMPLMVTLAIGYWNKKATSDKAKNQDFVACVTAGSITVICTNILDGRIQSDVELDMYIGEEIITEYSNIESQVHKALCDGIGSMILELQRPVSSIEHALLTWAPVKLGLKINNMKEQYSIIDVKELASIEVNGVLMSKNMDKNTLNTHCNGPPTDILSMCSHYFDSAGEVQALDGRKRKDIEAVIENIRIKYPKSFALSYKPNTQQLEETDLILIGIVGLKHPFRKAMEAFKEAGLTIKLVSKHSVAELKIIALQWGLNISNMDSDHSVILADEFRRYTPEQRIKMVDQICIMGNSLPSDKLLMVKCLKEKAHKILMVGMETDDVPSILEADLGISMEECCTETVKDSSKIVILRGNFSTLLSIIKFGRSAHENIRKFIRIELTMAIAWLLINIICTIFFGDCPITAIQFFWISLIEPFLGGMALLTMWPNDALMKKTPERGTATLITKTMWRSIVPEALYQTTILVTFQYKWAAVLGITSKKVVETMMFNSFVLCQVFNWFNAREMKEKNVLSDINRNCWFWVAMGATLVLQVTYTEMAYILANSARLNISQWAVCFAIGGASSVIDLLNKCIPDLAASCLLKQQCCMTESTVMSRSPSSSGSPSPLGLPLLKDDTQGLLAAVDSSPPITFSVHD